MSGGAFFLGITGLSGVNVDGHLRRAVLTLVASIGQIMPRSVDVSCNVTCNEPIHLQRGQGTQSTPTIQHFRVGVGVHREVNVSVPHDRMAERMCTTSSPPYFTCSASTTSG
jgi:hypothetical protein